LRHSKSVRGNAQSLSKTGALLLPECEYRDLLSLVLETFLCNRHAIRTTTVQSSPKKNEAGRRDSTERLYRRRPHLPAGGRQAQQEQSGQRATQRLANKIRRSATEHQKPARLRILISQHSKSGEKVWLVLSFVYNNRSVNVSKADDWF